MTCVVPFLRIDLFRLLPPTLSYFIFSLSVVGDSRTWLAAPTRDRRAPNECGVCVCVCVCVCLHTHMLLRDWDAPLRACVPTLAVHAVCFAGGDAMLVQNGLCCASSSPAVPLLFSLPLCCQQFSPSSPTSVVAGACCIGACSSNNTNNTAWCPSNPFRFSASGPRTIAWVCDQQRSHQTKPDVEEDSATRQRTQHDAFTGRCDVGLGRSLAHCAVWRIHGLGSLHLSPPSLLSIA